MQCKCRVQVLDTKQTRLSLLYREGVATADRLKNIDFNCHQCSGVVIYRSVYIFEKYSRIKNLRSF